VSDRAAGLGLAAGMLAELVITGHVDVQAGYLVPGVASEPPPGRMLTELLASLDLRRHDGDVGTWLRFLAVEAVEDVRHRLISDGAVARVAARGLVRRRVAHVPVDANQAAWPAIRLAKHLTHGLPLSLADMVLTGLVEAVGLLDTVLWLKPDHEPGWDRAAQVRRELPTALGDLVAHVDAAVGQGVLTGRASG
jgi:Golgi phosphoprotein 3 (GPP34)